MTSDAEILLLSMLINITPGSVTIDLSEDRRTFYVHVMHMKSLRRDAREIKAGFERRVKLLFEYAEDSAMLEIVSQLTLVTLAVALLLAFVRLVKGPTLPDRIVAMDLFGMLVVGLIVVLAGSSGVRATLDAAIVIAFIGFLGTIAYATYVERGDPQ